MGWGLCRHLREKPGWGLTVLRGSGGKLGTERDVGSKEGKGEKEEGKGGGKERERETTIHFPITQSLTVEHTYLTPLPLCPSHNHVTFPKPILSQTVLDIAPYFTGDHIGSFTHAPSALPEI